MPVTGSNFVFSWAMLHDGVMRLSLDELGDVTITTTSCAVCRDMPDREIIRVGLQSIVQSISLAEWTRMRDLTVVINLLLDEAGSVEHDG